MRHIADRLVRRKMNINESVEVKLTISDPERHIQDLLEYIREQSSRGHSFNVVVDPGDPERRREFWIDGDGSTRISKIEEA